MSQFTTALEKIFVHKDKPLPLRLLIYAAYLVPPVAVALLTWHDMTQADLDWASTEITLPHDAYQRQQASIPTWRPTPAYQEVFFEEFSKHYFGQTSRWPVLSPGMEAATLTVILKNTAESRSILVNSISVVGTLEDETPFDWRQLDVDAELAVEYDYEGNELKFVSQGLGPILDLQAKLKTDGGLALQPFEISYLRDESWLSLLLAEEYDSVSPIAHYDGQLSETVYRRIEEGEEIPEDASIVDCNPRELDELLQLVPEGVEPMDFFMEIGADRLEPADYRCDYVTFERYEAIRTLDRLRQVTEVHEAGAVQVDYSFKDIKELPSSGQETVGLPTPILWYRYDEDLSLDVTPEVFPTSASWEAGSDGTAGEAVSQAIALAKQIFGVSAGSPKGVGLIKSEHEIPAAIPECAFAQSIVEPRELLQGGGYVSISVDILQPKNGRYLLRVLVNGKERHALRIDILAPNDLVYDDWDDVDRFKADQAADPPPNCAPGDLQEAAEG